MNEKAAWRRNIVNYIVSMRLILALVPLTAAMIGFDLAPSPKPFGLRIITILLVGLGWGMNQVLNDLLGIDADRINAPQRPLCAGTLDKRFALIATFCLAGTGFIISLILNRPAALVFSAVLALNLAYNKLKKVFLNNADFALMIALCAVYGAFCSGIVFDTFCRQKLFLAALSVGVINFVFAFLTDFKDETGDKAVGVKNIVTICGRAKARRLIPFFLAAQFLAVLIFVKNAGHTLSVMVYVTFGLAVAAAIYSRRTIDQDNFSSKWPFIEALLLQTVMLLAS